MMKMRKKAPPKKELRIWFTPEHYERLERQAAKMDQTMAALVRHWAMEKVGVLEAIGAQTSAVDLVRLLNELERSKPAEEEKTRE